METRKFIKLMNKALDKNFGSNQEKKEAFLNLLDDKTVIKLKEAMEYIYASLDEKYVQEEMERTIFYILKERQKEMA